MYSLCTSGVFLPEVHREYMQNVDIKHVFPMHFWQEYAIYNKLMVDPRTKEYRERIEKITKPGQVFKL